MTATSRRLQAVPKLGTHQIHVGALTTVHVGMTLAIARRHNTLTGPLRFVPTQSMGDKRMLVVQLGDYSTALFPGDMVWVVPAGHWAHLVIEPRPKEPTDE